MIARARRSPRSLALPIGLSAILHAGMISTVFFLRASSSTQLPPMYRVDLVAAPPGPRAAGEVSTAPAPANPSKAPPRAESKSTGPTVSVKKGKAVRQPAKATPNVTAKSTPQKSTNAPRAGGGPTGGTGTDVATVRTEGIEFPFPGYLNNIVRQIALNFSPRNPNAPLKAEVMFLLRRDGTVSGFRFLTRSGSYAFDLECQGAVEAAAAGRAFGPLPAEFPDDVLPVIFSFDPRMLR